MWPSPAGREASSGIGASLYVRQTLQDILAADPAIEVVATAQDPYVAAEKLRRTVPDVITLDVEMPRMDGVTFLHKLMSQHPTPVVVCSSLVGEGSETLMRALEAGVVDIIRKPAIGIRRFLEDSRILIVDGAEGMLELAQAGAWTCAQDEASRVVYGIPKEAFLRGGTRRQIGLDKSAAALLHAS